MCVCVYVCRPGQDGCALRHEEDSGCQDDHQTEAEPLCAHEGTTAIAVLRVVACVSVEWGQAALECAFLQLSVASGTSPCVAAV